jgi:thiol:disulfide interchange protein DsbD
MVLVELYTDGPEEFAKPNQDLQLERFGSAAIPYYAILNGDGNIIREFAGRTRDVEEFRQFLTAGSPSGV